MDKLKAARRSGDRSAQPAAFATGVELLRKRALGNAAESWDVREQVFLAALDLHELEVAESLLKELETQFPESQRVMRLRGHFYEASAQPQEAIKVYAQLAKLSATNVIATKRKVSLLQASNKPIEAIKELSTYLDTYQADPEAWKHLALLYVQAGSFRNAAFCLEEVILCNPHSFLSFAAYAECLFTVGGDVGTMLDARRNFCQSLVKKAGPANARALWGLAVTTKAIQGYLDEAASNKPKTKEAAPVVDEEENKRLSAKALDELCNARMAPGMDAIVKAAAKKLSIA